MPGTLIVSPHLDDALLSASQVAMSTPTTVVTVFAGPPPASVRLTEWDRLTGAASSLRRHQDRIVEDQRANAAAGSRPLHLSYPEEQFRQGPLDAVDCVAELRALLTRADQVWIPVGIGAHPDHLLARCIALAALPEDGPSPAVGFYGDFPYIAAFGWPSWVTGLPTEEYLDLSAWLDLELRNVGFPADGFQRQVVILTESERKRKAEIIAEYRSQLPGLRLDPSRIGQRPHALDYEVRWLPEPEALALLVRDGRTALSSP